MLEPSLCVDGIINLTVLGGKNIECYAIIMESTETSYNTVKDDFNLYSSGVNRIANYNNAAFTDRDRLSGTTNGPILSTNLNLTGKSKYKLLLTGYDAPKMNAGELMSLYYNGGLVYNDNDGKSSNAQNYAVIYKFKVSNFTGTKAVFEYSPYTNPNYFADPDSGIYVAYAIYQNGVLKSNKSKVLLQPQYIGYSTEFDAENVPQGDFDIYVVVSGMSSMPLTLRFE